ncbi:hypothetical protein HanRHA438_Chr16g0749941 [Helianthus annuus]|nr:hypothetical protein HanIR_Chr16g0801901 [Helianthus annuus]KAJ0644134.1 hypothetical protein HanOQP8_Chr16g0608521 [Helianthus annuus]KAJ0820378.1 hypothetical protein HanPSC8_Chr16g0707251 [Helianthus annuus]KAJ0834986.1 hypothetical protein HanRHA438_Chr16g0749941 [Helianthus annuus]
MDRDTGSSYMFTEEEEEGGDEEMGEGEGDEGDEEEEDPGRRPGRQRRSKHKEVSGFVANFIRNRRKNAFRNYNLGHQDVYDNVSVAIAEAREREERRMKSEEEGRNKQEEMWALTKAHWEQERLEMAQEVSRRLAWEQEQERLRVAREALEDRRWATTAIGQQIYINNTNTSMINRGTIGTTWQASRTIPTHRGRITQIFPCLVAHPTRLPIGPRESAQVTFHHICSRQSKGRGAL